MGRSRTIVIGMLSAACTLRAQRNAACSSSTNGKTINYNLAVSNPPVPIHTDPARSNQESAINGTILFLSKLHPRGLRQRLKILTRR